MIDKLQFGVPEDLTAAVHRIKFDQQLAQLAMLDRIQQMRASNPQMYGQAVRPGDGIREPNASVYLPVRPRQPAPSPGLRFSAGRAGLVEALRAGVLRLGGPGDVGAWKAAYSAKNGRMPSKEFDEMLGHPDTDPHGDPIPGKEGTILERHLETLLTCPVATQVVVARVTDQDPVFLRFVERNGLKPGELVEVEARDEAADAVRLRGRGATSITIGARAASKLLVDIP